MKLYTGPQKAVHRLIDAVDTRLKDYPDIPAIGYDDNWPSVNWKPNTLPLDIGSVAATLVNGELLKNEVKRMTRNKTTAIIPDEGLYEWKIAYSEDVDAQIKQDYPNAIILNSLPLDKAADELMRSGF